MPRPKNSAFSLFEKYFVHCLIWGSKFKAVWIPPTTTLKSFRYFVSNFLVMIFLFLAKVIVRINKDNALFLGRGIHYPIALEGSLKLKEISYIHAEAYPAGELKHGPLALVDKNMPVVVIAPNDVLLEKVKSNMQEVKARGGILFVFADSDSHFVETKGIKVIRAPRHSGILSPIIHTIPVQLLAYHVALRKGTDVDKPRNLAKSVTVE